MGQETTMLEESVVGVHVKFVCVPGDFLDPSKGEYNQLSKLEGDYASRTALVREVRKILPSFYVRSDGIYLGNRSRVEEYIKAGTIPNRGEGSKVFEFS